MKKYRRILTSACLLVIAGTCLLLMSSCKNDLNDAIEDVAVDAIVDEMEYNRLIDEFKVARKCLSDDGEIDENVMKAFVQNYANRKWRDMGEIQWPAPPKSKPLSFQLFLESSGSMYGYDSRRTDGKYKAAIGNILNIINKINIDTKQEPSVLYIVNDSVVPTNITLNDFLFNKMNDSVYMSEIRDIGDPNYTYFSQIFDSILSRSNNNEVSILVSDLIYSSPSNDPKQNSSRDFLLQSEAQSARGPFTKYNDIDVIVIKFKVGFWGNYFTYDEPFGKKHYNGKRPVYFMIVAKHNVMQQLFNDPTYKEFISFSAWKQFGFENYYCFTKGQKEPMWSVLYTDPFGMTQASFSAARDGKEQIHNIEKLSVSRSRGGNNSTVITVAMDLSNIIVDTSYLNDVNNYMIDDNEGGWVIQDVIPLKKENRTTDVTNYVKNATHLLVLSTEDKPMNEKLHITLYNELPQWIEESTSYDDRNYSNDPNFENTTWGFKTMMEGIQTAFYGLSEKPQYFEITLGVKR